jgi:hypothetical protein
MNAIHNFFVILLKTATVMVVVASLMFIPLYAMGLRSTAFFDAGFTIYATFFGVVFISIPALMVLRVARLMVKGV